MLQLTNLVDPTKAKKPPNPSCYAVLRGISYFLAQESGYKVLNVTLDPVNPSYVMYEDVYSTFIVHPSEPRLLCGSRNKIEVIVPDKSSASNFKIILTGTEPFSTALRWFNNDDILYQYEGKIFMHTTKRVPYSTPRPELTHTIKTKFDNLDKISIAASNDKKWIAVSGMEKGFPLTEFGHFGAKPDEQPRRCYANLCEFVNCQGCTVLFTVYKKSSPSAHFEIKMLAIDPPYFELPPIRLAPKFELDQPFSIIFYPELQIAAIFTVHGLLILVETDTMTLIVATQIEPFKVVMKLPKGLGFSDISQSGMGNIIEFKQSLIISSLRDSGKNKAAISIEQAILRSNGNAPSQRPPPSMLSTPQLTDIEMEETVTVMRMMSGMLGPSGGNPQPQTKPQPLTNHGGSMTGMTLDQIVSPQPAKTKALPPPSIAPAKPVQKSPKDEAKALIEAGQYLSAINVIDRNPIIRSEIIKIRFSPSTMLHYLEELGKQKDLTEQESLQLILSQCTLHQKTTEFEGLKLSHQPKVITALSSGGGSVLLQSSSYHLIYPCLFNPQTLENASKFQLKDFVFYPNRQETSFTCYFTTIISYPLIYNEEKVIVYFFDNLRLINFQRTHPNLLVKLMSLSHPCIAEPIGYDNDQEIKKSKRFMIMIKRYEGIKFEEARAHPTFLDGDKITRILVGVALAYQFLHSQGIVLLHPISFLLTNDGDPILLDPILIKMVTSHVKFPKTNDDILHYISICQSLIEHKSTPPIFKQMLIKKFHSFDQIIQFLRQDPACKVYIKTIKKKQKQNKSSEKLRARARYLSHVSGLIAASLTY